MGKWKRNRSLPRRWQRNHLIQKYGSVCYLCGEPFVSAKDITFDHWEPLSKGGSDLLDNYRLAHDGCNQLKAAMLPEEFRDFQLGKIQYAD
jgi:5-methylcytosine-specific restriction endonuclease McrA